MALRAVRLFSTTQDTRPPAKTKTGPGETTDGSESHSYLGTKPRRGGRKLGMLSTLFTLGALLLFSDWPNLRADEPTSSDWKQALPGWTYHFPADHEIHPDFKTEWWYFTGHLRADDGHAYGYELTFFRQGILPPGARPPMPTDGVALSRFVKNDFKFAHFAISDLKGKQFYYSERTSRGAYGEAGFGGIDHTNPGEKRLAWLENWQLDPQPDGAWHIRASTSTPTPMQINLVVNPVKPPAIEGMDGVSQKSAGLGNASHYYSFTRMDTTGSLALGDGAAAHPVKGESWFDHEWASNELVADQVGWDWFCFQFDDRTELMLYAMRRRDGSIDPASAGTLIDANGNTEHLNREDFQMHATRTWHSDKTKATYPLAWKVSIPSRQMEFTLESQMDDQELALPLISYWEGGIVADGQRAGRKLTGLGYMELTGYSTELQALRNSKTSGPDLPRTAR